MNVLDRFRYHQNNLYWYWPDTDTGTRISTTLDRPFQAALFLHNGVIH